ncbi:MAG: ankyrin repeat domain-containing protein, partial [Spirochaetota bacterium]
MKTSILNLLFDCTENPYNEIRQLLEKGANPNESTEYFETPLRVSSQLGYFDTVKLLFEYGGDPSHLEWTTVFHKVAYGSVTEIEKCIAEGIDLKHRDTWERTVFLLAVQTGSIAKASALLNAGADLNDTGLWGSTIEYAIHANSGPMLQWLLDQGMPSEKYNDYGYTPLMEAATQNTLQCVKVLVSNGVNIYRKDRNQFSRSSAISHTSNLDIALYLSQAGDAIEKNTDVRAELLGIGNTQIGNFSKKEYERLKGRKFGTSNPEQCMNPLWMDAIRCNKAAYDIRNKFDDDGIEQKSPVWCYERYGKSLTPLDNEAYIEIAGEHEDHYDPDFCIYNEVVYFPKPGTFQIFMYPKDIFPPTDFHTATLLGENIYIIGNLGYMGERKYGTTPVYRLNILSFAIEKIETTGDNPGWIHKHSAFLEDSSHIRICGGEVLGYENKQEVHSYNCEDFLLDLHTMNWSRTTANRYDGEGAFFSEKCKTLDFSEGTLIGIKKDEKWQLLKIIKIHRVDVEVGDIICIRNQQMTVTESDFLYIVVFA